MSGAPAPDGELDRYIRAARTWVDRAWLASSLLRQRGSTDPRRFPTFPVQLAPEQGGLTAEELQSGAVTRGRRRSLAAWICGPPFG